ncbi:MAG: SpoIID/LytB domain-containing protein [Acidobacteriia bacterium]|nr:SpoIID/LytB domain-containing protein [Terriglobia bacterium]
MKAAWLLLLLAAAFPGAGRAEEVRVRFYATHPPAEAVISVAAGELRWKTCAQCPENTAKRLLLQGAGGEVMVKDAGTSAEIFIQGKYRLEAAGMPYIEEDFALRVTAREGRLLLTAQVPLEEYTAAVLAGETGEFRNAEALKAMAVTVRTYATRFRGRHGDEGYDFCDTTHCQFPRWNGARERFRVAAAATQGEELWFNGGPAAAHYHQNCGGMIAAGSEAWSGVREAYLRAHADRYCVAGAPLRWESALAVADLDAALRAAGITPPAGWTKLEVAARTGSGRVRLVRLGGGALPVLTVAASSLRFAVGRALGWEKLRSDLYEVRGDGGKIIFSGHGAGHGVGLCQAGAEEMGREGRTYQEILNFYYPGTTVKGADEEAWKRRESERFELLSTQPEEDTALLDLAEKILKENEAAAGWKIGFRVRLKVFSTLKSYRDTTGQAGWVAATTRGNTIRLQPLAVLKQKRVLESTLRHELFHVLVESRGQAELPLWFREGLVLYLSAPEEKDKDEAAMSDRRMEKILENPASREQMQQTYRAARMRVAQLFLKFGRAAVLDWLSSGIPGGALDGGEPPGGHRAEQQP